jgi:hypothetical protein
VFLKLKTIVKVLVTFPWVPNSLCCRRMQEWKARCWTSCKSKLIIPAQTQEEEEEGAWGGGREVGVERKVRPSAAAKKPRAAQKEDLGEGQRVTARTPENGNQMNYKTTINKCWVPLLKLKSF